MTGLPPWMRPVRHPELGGRFDVIVDRHDSPFGRWTMVAALPRGPLGERVEAIWASRGEGVFTHEEILPRTPTEVLFSLGETHWLRDPADPSRDRPFAGAFVSGLQLRPLAVESPPDSSMAGIRLKPAGAAAFLRDSPALIAGDVVPLDAVLGGGVELLREQLMATADLHRRVLLLAGAVERHLAPVPPTAPAIQHALDELRLHSGNLAIRDLVVASGWSHRHFTRRFQAEIGLRPKAFARIARFQSAFERLQTVERVDWADFALEHGFFDQAHLARELRELAGTTPTDLLRRRAPDGLGLVVDAG